MSDQPTDLGLAFIDSCDSITLMMIHGFPFSSAMWEPQIEDLASVTRVIAPDLRGHGRSQAVPGSYTMEMLADDCVGLLDYLAITTPVVVCGLSMGGYVAFEFFRRYPELVAGLILTSTRALPDTPQGKANRDKMAAKAQTEGVAAIAADMLPKLFSPKTYEENEEVVDFVQEMMEWASVDGVVGALAAMRDRPDSSPTLTEIDVPTLIIHGADDKIVPLAEAEAMRDAIPNAQLVVIPDAGHVPNLEQIDAFNDAVMDFLMELQDAYVHDHNHHH
ncbi:MAG: alpha/beta hydrolase [Chloroflexi bacterium]|nr:MAG: alpha/beta hydrolase [Chloroflexota bacterium]